MSTALFSRKFIEIALVAIGILACLSYIFSHADDYGITWDENIKAAYGDHVLAYFTSGFEDESYLQLRGQKSYGPMAELIKSLVVAISGGDRFDVRHLVNAIFALIAVLGTYVYGRRMSGVTCAVLSTVILILMPRFLGHAFNNPKDIPFAAAVVWVMVTMTRALAQRRWQSLIWCGICIGLAGAVRPGGLIIIGSWWLAGCAYIVLKEPSYAKKSLSLDLAFKTALIFAVSWLVMVAFWPWAHLNPLINPIKAIFLALEFPESYQVLFFGDTIASHDLPFHYLIAMFAITTPILTLFFLAVGVIFSLRRLLDRLRCPTNIFEFLVLSWVFIPLLLFMIVKPNSYDGIRHFLFLLPGLAVLAGYGCARLIDLIEKPRIRRIVCVLVLVATAIPIRDLIVLHPYQNSYFNGFVGGIRGAEGRFDLDYWTSSYRECMLWINDLSKTMDHRPLTVLVAANELNFTCAAHYKAPQILLLKAFRSTARKALPDQIDVYLSTVRYELHKNFPDTETIHEVGRCGATFAVIKARPGFYLPREETVQE